MTVIPFLGIRPNEMKMFTWKPVNIAGLPPKTEIKYPYNW